MISIIIKIDLAIVYLEKEQCLSIFNITFEGRKCIKSIETIIAELHLYAYC